MKYLKNISILMLTVCLFVLVSSCDDDSDKFVANETSPVQLSELTISEIELDPVNTNNPAVTFNWSRADYGQPAAVRYNVEISFDADFTNTVIATTISGNNTATLSVGELNSAAGSVGAPAFDWSTIYARITSSLGTQDGLPVDSNSISFMVYPYFNYPFDDYYLVGNGTAPGWNNNDNNPALFRDSDNPSLYYYTAYFSNDDGDYGNGRWKVLEERGLWQPQWGVTDDEGSDDPKTSGEIAGNPGTQGSDPGRFGVAASGYYEFTFNISTKKYTTEAYDASGATEFTSMSIQGAASETTAMTQSTFDAHIWNIPSIRLVPGELQFLTNTGSTWGSSTAFSGVAQEGGSIPVVVEDDYEVWFNTLSGRYIMIPLNL
ncbi:SusE domain-containing protein [uncultured Algibacter sp.]|uniref:SusE domain-containing protein n=1 Tax=uncultured Algibacter sp. TaxID=298659 RepID=UPI002626DC8F|nr:SusE domain-containing protein [uncultured Algibacter sp.]